MTKNVLVYKGRGVGPLSFKETLITLRQCLPSGYKVKTVETSEVIEGQVFNDASLFVLPGGRDVPYHEDLQGKGNAHIEKFVSRGGAFLGICAGAYYGASEVQFEKGHPLEVQGTRELRFFPGTAEGPLYELGTYVYGSEASAKASAIRIEGEDLYVYYNGGCCFLNAENYPETVSVLGTYQDATETPLAAIIMCHRGLGKVILSGVHIDYRPEGIKNMVSHSLVECLEAYDEARLALVRQLLLRLLM